MSKRNITNFDLLCPPIHYSNSVHKCASMIFMTLRHDYKLANTGISCTYLSKNNTNDNTRASGNNICTFAFRVKTMTVNRCFTQFDTNMIFEKKILKKFIRLSTAKTQTLGQYVHQDTKY